MFVALGAGEPSVAMFHLMTHAFFKALLFLGSGSVIHATHHTRRWTSSAASGRRCRSPGTTFFIGSLALAGIPPLAGFWSKDEIIVALSHSWGAWALILLGFAAICTAFYTTRLFIRTFLGKPKDQHVYEHTHEYSFIMTGPLIFLCLLAIVTGFVIFHDVGKALGFPGGITEFIFLAPSRHAPLPLRLGLSRLPRSGLASLGIWIGAWMYWKGNLDKSTRLANFQPAVYGMIKNKFYFDEMYQFFIDKGVLGFSYVVSWFDRYVVNDTGVDGTAQATGYSGFILKYLQTGKVPNYAMGIAFGVVGLALAGLVARG